MAEPEITKAVIGSWADYISLDWSREEDRPMLRKMFPAWVIEEITKEDDAL